MYHRRNEFVKYLKMLLKMQFAHGQHTVENGFTKCIWNILDFSNSATHDFSSCSNSLIRLLSVRSLTLVFCAIFAAEI